MSEFNIEIEVGSSKRLPVGNKWCPEDIIVRAVGEGFDEDVLGDFLSNRLKKLDCNATKIPTRACQERTSLVSANLPNVTYMGQYAFYKCSNLVTIYAPNLSSISTYVFRECTALTEVNFPLLASVPNYTFYLDKALSKADVGVASSIGSQAFYNAPIKTLILRKSDGICTLSNTDAFASSGIGPKKGNIYVPSALIEEYKNATNWSTYASIFRAIEDYPEICGG